MDRRSEFANLATNLRLLCGFYGSISEVCRALEINRQQFNRYLAGTTCPSYKNLKSICDFFGVEQQEIMLDAEVFREMVSPETRATNVRRIPDRLDDILDPMFQTGDPRLAKLEGYYFRYFYSFGFPGYIYRTFVKVYLEEGTTYFKHIERASGKEPTIGRMRSVTEGVIFLMRDRLFLIEREPALDSTFSETILSPSYRPNYPYLSGVMACTSTCSAHLPGSARTVFEYLGRKIDVRHTLRRCDLFHRTDPEISESVKQAITNTVAPDEFTLQPGRI